MLHAVADAFTFASRTETQGLVLLEAMAVGLPVLAIPALGAAEIIAPARGATPAADTPAEFAGQLLELLDSPQRLAAMAGDAIAFAREWDADAQGETLACAIPGPVARPDTGSSVTKPSRPPDEHELLVEESPFKGQTGLRRVWNASNYSLSGLRAAYLNEDAFRQETLLATLMIPLAMPSSGIGKAMMIGSVLLVLYRRAAQLGD